MAWVKKASTFYSTFCISQTKLRMGLDSLQLAKTEAKNVPMKKSKFSFSLRPSDRLTSSYRIRL